MPDLLEEAKRLSDLVRWLRNWTVREGAGRGDRRRIERFHRWADEIAELVERVEQAERVVEAARNYIDCWDAKPRFVTADLNPYSPRGRRESLRQALAAADSEAGSRELTRSKRDGARTPSHLASDDPSPTQSAERSAE